MAESSIGLHTVLHRNDLTLETDGAADDPCLELSILDPVSLTEGGVTNGAPELVLRTGAEGLALTSRDDVLRLQAMVNRAVNQWRDVVAERNLP